MHIFLDITLLHIIRLQCSVNITFKGTGKPRNPLASLYRGGLEPGQQYFWAGPVPALYRWPHLKKFVFLIRSIFFFREKEKRSLVMKCVEHWAGNQDIQFLILTLLFTLGACANTLTSVCSYVRGRDRERQSLKTFPVPKYCVYRSPMYSAPS